MTETSLEIPQAVELTGQMEQALAAYGQFAGFVRSDGRPGVGAMPLSLAAGFKDIRDRTMDFAEENAEAACAFAGKVCNAKTLQEIFVLEARFVQDRLQTFVKNMQELQGLAGESGQRWGRN